MNVCLCNMTKDIMHAFFKAFQYDVGTTPEKAGHTYVYDEKQVNDYYEKHQRQGKLHFAIMLGDTVIGDVYLKHIDQSTRSCEMGIHIANDCYKGKGYGTQAELQLLAIAFNQMNMDVVFAETRKENSRSRAVLEKVGFTEICCKEDTCYYECRKDHWKNRENSQVEA